MNEIQKLAKENQYKALKEHYEKQVKDIMQHSDLTREEAEETHKRARGTMKYALMPAEKINDICDSGAFNPIIIGYMLLILDEMQLTNQVDRSELEQAARVVFDIFGAKAARERSEQ